MATLPSKLPSDNVSCHRALIYLRALFIDTRTSTDHTHHTAVFRTAVASLSPLRFTVHSSPPTSISSWKRSRWPHDLLFEEDLVDTQSRPSTIQLHPREIRSICWTLLEWYSVSLWALVKIHLHVYGEPGSRINRYLFEVQTPAVFNCYSQERQFWIWLWCRGNNKSVDTLCSLIC